MRLPDTHVEKIKILFANEDFAYTLQAVELVDTLVDTEEDFIHFLERVPDCELSSTRRSRT